MPELPEVEITARRIGEAVSGVEVESAIAPGINTLKTFAPPLDVLSGHPLTGVRRRGKHLVVDSAAGVSLLIHLMSAGRLQLYADKRSSLRDRTSRLLVRLEGGGELRLREFGTKQAAWVKTLPTDELEADESLATLGPDAWPDPPADFAELLSGPRPLRSLIRDQRVLAGVGRSWSDEILHAAKLSPFKRGDDLTPEEATALRGATIDLLGGAIDHYEANVRLPVPDKMPMPLTVHRRVGEPCPRCGDVLRAVSLAEDEIAYCATCQTGGRVLKDRRLSRLLK
jgi:formamidopyrimidine-DNA glycosylase